MKDRLNDFTNSFKQRNDKKKKVTWKAITVTVCALSLAVVVLLSSLVIGNARGGKSYSGDEGAADKTKPVIKGPEGNSVIVYTGETVSFRSFVSATDNSGSCDLFFDEAGFNVNQEGTYTVVYTATDASGNATKYSLTVNVVHRQYTFDSLMTLVDGIAANNLGYTRSSVGSRSKAQIVRDIYSYAKSAITFDDSISNAYRQSQQNGRKRRIGWKVDYIEEASITLTSSVKKGDCYTFYSVSKAFYEYFGIDNAGFQRSEASTLDGTHYWNAVNIGTSSSPEWYYVDCTPYAGSFSDGSNACLVTESSLASYETSKGVKNQYYVIEKNDPEFFEAEDNGGKFPVIGTLPA